MIDLGFYLSQWHKSKGKIFINLKFMLDIPT
jgi:hypothetical protein